jgi:hypothetical protein
MDTAAPHVVARIPGNAPLVLRPHRGRFLAFYGTLYLGVPLAIQGILLIASLIWLGPRSVGDLAGGFAIVGGIMIAGGLFQLGLVAAFMMTGGPYLAASADGLWIRARKWPVRAMFLPWGAIQQVYARRWMLEKAVCVVTHDPHTGERAGLGARLDMRTQRLFFGARLTAPTFFCGRNADEVLADLHRLSGGRV